MTSRAATTSRGQGPRAKTKYFRWSYRRAPTTAGRGLGSARLIRGPPPFLLALLPHPTATPQRPPVGAGEGRKRLQGTRPRLPPRLPPQGQEARKEPPGAMDGAVMEGPLFLQSQRFGTKKWRKTWAVLYPASPHGVARLEFFDHKGSSSGGGRGSSRRLDCKVIRLAECVSVAPVTVETPPEPGATAFRLDTAQRSHLLAADAPSSAAWVQTLCRNAFPKGSWTLAPSDNPPKLSALEMLENSLYSPTWEGHVLFRGWPPLPLRPWNLHLPDSTGK
ncbi:docking protein 1 isoform X3 [Papio anubis]|nr:docking protein 1 isoform X3 [Papio anubis]